MLGNCETFNVPIEYQYDNKSGRMNCIKSLFSIGLEKATDIYFVIWKSHAIKFDIINRLSNECSMMQKKLGLNANIHYDIVDRLTSSQAETVNDCINRNGITSPIIIKDADNMCRCSTIIPMNGVLTYPLESISLVDPIHKSYIMVDEHNFITNTIEKRVISGTFNCGGYVFSDASQFSEAFDAIHKYESNNAHMYISHIIYWLILNKGLRFRPIACSHYEDFTIPKI